MKTQHLKLAIAMMLGAVPMTSASAWGTERGWMIGGGQGEADYHASVADFDDGSIVAGRTDSHELGWKLFAGYRFNRLFSIEVGYVELENDFDDPTFAGVSDGAGSFFVSAPGGPVSQSDSPRGVFVEAVGSLPLGKGLFALGKLGVFDWENESVVRDLNGRTTFREGGTDPVVGVGVEYRLQRGLAFRVEHELFTEVVGEDIDLTTVGISYRF